MTIYKIIILLLIFYTTHAQEFIYPVAHFDQGNQLIFAHQKSLYDIDLLIVNQNTKIVTQALSSFLIPANVQILPTQDGFSFVDRGFVKIKYFCKRSPKTIPIYAPISLISSVHWIDKDNFYFTARQGDFYQTFQSNIDGDILRLSCEPIDILYPVKIDNYWFCIKRNVNHEFVVTEQIWNPTDFETYDKTESSIIVPLTDKVLCFLHMLSMKEGFYLHAHPYNATTQMYTFSCYQLIKENNIWQSYELFDFSIPSKYIQGQDRLYESIEPFLPKYTIPGMIIYVNYNSYTETLELLQYHIAHQKSQECHSPKKLFSEDQFFAPYIIKDQLYLGRITQNNYEQNIEQMLCNTIISV